MYRSLYGIAFILKSMNQGTKVEISLVSAIKKEIEKNIFLMLYVWYTLYNIQNLIKRKKKQISWKVFIESKTILNFPISYIIANYLCNTVIPNHWLLEASWNLQVLSELKKCDRINNEKTENER